MIRKIFSKIRNRLRDVSVYAAHALHRMTHDYSYVNGVIEKYHNNPSLKKDIYQPYKLWSLVQILEKHKPKKILEFGGGSSTVVFGDYAKKYGAEIISVESDAAWAEKIKEFVAGNDNVKVIFAKSMGFPQTTPPQLKYDIHLDEVFDLVMIDGPGEQFEGIARKQGATVNALELNQPKLVLVYGRKVTVQYMKDKMNGYVCSQSDLHTLDPVKPGYNYFSLFSKK